jgi:formyltetrahydrofolate deformylase
MATHLLLINCPDERGLVYKITKVLYEHQLNVLSNGEFVDRTLNHFFMRTEFSGEFDKSKLLTELKATLSNDAEITLTDKRKKNILLLATKEYHCFSDILIRHAFDDLNANILGVISNYEKLKNLSEKFNLPYHFVDHEGKSREQHEEEILKILFGYNPEYIVLAKYMRILSKNFVSHFPNKIINIHHSFLPAFVGANPYVQAFERGVKIIGATAHFVNDNLDEGPIIAQSVIPVDHTHSAREMAQAGRDVEKMVLSKSLRLVFNDHVFVHKNKTIIFD